MRLALLPIAMAVSLAAFYAQAADAPAATPAAEPSSNDDGTTDAARGTMTAGAPAQDHASHTMSYSAAEPDVDAKPSDAGKQVNLTGVVEARAPDTQIVCKYSPIIGSRMSTKLCLPMYRWKQMHQDAQQMMRDAEATSHYGGAELGFGTP
jgi:hypothetical protein